MGKETKIKIKYRLGETPTELSSLLSKADETDLRILVSLMMLADADGIADTSPLYEKLGFEKDDVTASLKFWRGGGMIDTAVCDAKSEKDKKSGCADPSKKTSTHKNGAIEISGKLDEYSATELADIMEKRVVSAQFVDEAQRIMGKIFRTYDTGILVGIVDRLGFEEEAVLVILDYIVQKGKKTMRYAETLAMALYDEGITDTAAVTERIARMQHSGETVEKIKCLYGIRDRALTASEKKYFSSWVEDFDFDIEVIRMAYDITVDNTQKPIPKYTNTILERWRSEGLRTEADVRSFLARQESDKSGSSVAKSYDSDDFFEAALQRCYDDLK